MGTQVERAVVITYNWTTGETLHTAFDGPDAGIHADQFMAGEVERGDFPRPDWIWFMHANESARKVMSEQFVKLMMGE